MSFQSPFRGFPASRRSSDGVVAPAIVGTPFIVGDGIVGSEHSVGGFVVTGTPEPALLYSWKVGATEVATSPTYVLTSADVVATGSAFSSAFSSAFGGANAGLSVSVAATNASGTAGPTTSAAIQVYPLTPGLVTVGITEAGGLTGSTFHAFYYGATDAESITYEWRLNAVPIAGAVDASVTIIDAGLLTVLVTATHDGQVYALESDPAAVYHVQVTRGFGSTAATVASGTLDLATREISDQAFLNLVSYEGPAPTTTTQGGVTLTTFTEGAAATAGGKTLTCRKVSVLSTDKRSYVFTLEGLTGTKDCDFSFTTGTAHTYLKMHGYQISGYDLDEIVLQAVVGTGTSLDVPVVKPAGGLAIGFANRMPSITAPAGWTTAFALDPVPPGDDTISGYLAGSTPYQGSFTFTQPTATANQQAMSVAIPSLPVVYPELIGVPTMTGATAPVEGTPITLNIAEASAGTDTIQVRVYRMDPSRVPASATVEYVVGSAAPAPTYTPTTADVGALLVLGETPLRGGLAGVERYSLPSGEVVAAAVSTEPGLIAANKFTFVGNLTGTDGNGVAVQRALTTIKAGITIPAGWEIALLRTVQPGVTAASGHPELSNVRTLAQLSITYTGSLDATWQSGGGAVNGVTQYLYVYWVETATGRRIDGTAIPYSFVSVATVAPDLPPPSPPPNLGAANQTLAAANQATLVAALNTRAGSGSAAEWIIDCPNGNYGNLSLAGMVLPGKTIIRSQNLNLGAKFGWINLVACKNIQFQFVDADATLRGAWDTNNVAFKSSDDCGISYSRCYAGGIYLAAPQSFAPVSWIYNITNNICINNDTPTGASSYRTTVHMNLVEGVCAKAIYVNGSRGAIISDNMLVNTGADGIMVSWGSDNQFLRNWGPRATYPCYGVAGNPMDHSDFIQYDIINPAAPGSNYTAIGNVMMVGNYGLPEYPRQAVFGSKCYASNFYYNNNICCNNSYHGVTITGPSITGANATYNTCIRCIDAPGDQFSARISGMNSASFNVQCVDTANNTSAGGGSLNIVTTATDHDNSLAYYTAPYMNSTFYELRPVAGAVTHWAYSGARVGAYQRFYDVIVGGQYPKYGPAAAAWKTWYDPKNQITS